MALADSLAAAWQLNETQRNRFDVISGAALTPHRAGTVDSTAVTRIAGKAGLGYAAQFTRANSTHLRRVSTDSKLELGGLGATGWWIWAWVKLTSLPGVNDQYGIISKSDDVLGTEYQLKLYNDGTPYRLYLSGMPMGDMAMTVTLDTTDWHLYEAWYDGTNYNLAVDGGAATSAAGAAHVSKDSNFHLGAGFHTAHHLNGSICAPAVRKAKPAAGERTALWNGGSGTIWPFGSPPTPATFQVVIDNTQSATNLDAGRVLPFFLPNAFAYSSLYYGNGDDFEATDALANPLLVWPEEVDRGAGYGRVWIQTPAVLAGASTTVTLASGDSTQHSQDNYDTLFAKRVADGNTVALFPCDTVVGAATASTVNGHSLALTAVPTLATEDGGNLRVLDPPQKFASGGYLTFNGTSQYGLATGLLDTPPAAGCVGLRFKYDANPGAGDVIFSKASAYSGANITEGMVLRFGTSHIQIVFEVFSGGSTYSATIEVASGFIAGIWHHLVVSWGTKLTIWIDGHRHAQGTRTGAWTAGSASPFAVGAKYLAAASDHLAFSVDEIEVRDTEPTRDQVKTWFNRGGLPQSYELERWTRSASNPLLAATLVDEQGVVFEPVPMRRSTGVWFGVYTGGNSVASLFGMTSTDGKIWTKTGAKAMGNGTGGWAGNACRPSLLEEDGTYYLYFSDAIATLTGNVRYATSTDGLTWTHQGVLIAPDAVRTGYANASVVKVGATFYWMLEHLTAAGGQAYRSSHFTSSSPTGPLTYQETDLITATLQQGVGTVSSRLHYFDGAFHMFCHLGRYSNLPTTIYHAISEDCKRWGFLAGADPVIDLDDFSILSRQDQTADAHVYEIPETGEVGIMFDIDDNNGGGLQTRIMGATFVGDIDELGREYPSVSVRPPVVIGPPTPGATLLVDYGNRRNRSRNRR